MSGTLADLAPPSAEADADRLYDIFSAWATDRGLPPYDHQDEALIELLSGRHVVLATPTGSGKSLVATGAQFAALAEDRVSFYTAPIKALVSEKFFDLCGVFGADNVGMLTGDASVNPDAPIICCTAEVLAHVALREGASADVGLVVMDEFHYYGDPQRGWAWQVPLLELPQAQFLLMSATLGDTSAIAAALTARSGREVAVVDDAERPVPLSFSYVIDAPLGETLETLVQTHQAPVYVVHFTQAAAVEHATGLRSAMSAGKEQRAAIAERLRDVRFAAGFGKTLQGLLRQGIGVHHAGMLPRYRRLVEQLAQAGLLTVICGTDTLGVGINVPIRTVLFTGLAKYDGRRQRVLTAREFHQIAGRAGRPGYDTHGYVVVQAPEHVIENEKAKAKAAERQAAGKKRSRAQLRKPPEGTVVWTEQTYDKVVAGTPETLKPRMKVDHAMLLHVAARDEDGVAVLRRLLMDNHEDRRQQLRLARRAAQLARSLVASGVLVRLDELDERGRRYDLGVDVPDDFALNQPLAHFALEALELLDPDEPTYPLDVVSVVEAALEAPRPVLLAQRHAARGEAIAQMKADGVEYEERMERLEDITWPEPLAELLETAFEHYRAGHPWLPPEALVPKSVVREMYEGGLGFSDFISTYRLARSEGLLLRYLTDAYRTLRQTVPERHRTEELQALQEWLGETVRQTDSSLLDEWEALTDPEAVRRAAEERAARAEPRPPSSPRPLSLQERAFRVMVRNAVWRRVELAARDDLDGLARTEQEAAQRPDPPRSALLDRAGWDAALEAYYTEHDRIDTGADARGPGLFHVEPLTGAPPGVRTGADREPDEVRLWRVRQTLDDPEGHHDWVLECTVDLDASDEAGEAVVLAAALHRLDGVTGTPG